MSVFTADETPASYLEALVGEGKKFSDPEQLAKGKWEADRVIERRENELAELRRELESRETVESLFAKLQAQPNTPQNETPKPEAHQPAKPTASLTDDELVEKIRQITSAEKQSEQIQRNVDEVAQKLIDVYGDEAKANAVVRNKAAELGVSVEFLQEVAAKSPKAFFSQIGLDASPASPARPTQGDVNTAALAKHSPEAKPGTYAFYENLRKTNPSAYFSPKIQNQMHKDALANPEAFFNRK